VSCLSFALPSVSATHRLEVIITLKTRQSAQRLHHQHPCNSHALQDSKLLARLCELQLCILSLSVCLEQIRTKPQVALPVCMMTVSGLGTRTTIFSAITAAYGRLLRDALEFYTNLVTTCA
jgi:hypothetical protein